MSVPSPGDRIAGRYQLEGPIGRGANASVFRARDATLARGVALKFLFVRDPRHTQWLKDHFLREARLAAAVDHPNVVHTIDFGTYLGRPFMVMELLEGESLAARLAREPPLELAQVVDLHRQILEGLSAVHAAGIIHRDLKPDNVILLPGASGYRPKIVDFGVSKATRPGSGVRSALTTREGLVVGTPEYMSPEQARGSANVDERSDVYGVGVMLYEALAGEVPYGAETMADLLVAIVRGGAPEVRTLRPDLPEALSAVVARAMALDPQARFASAADMARALTLALPASAMLASADAGTVAEYEGGARHAASAAGTGPQAAAAAPTFAGAQEEAASPTLEAAKYARAAPSRAAGAASSPAAGARGSGERSAPRTASAGASPEGKRSRPEAGLGSADTVAFAGPSRSLPQVDQSTPPMASLMTQLDDARRAEHSPLELAATPLHRPGIVRGPDSIGLVQPGRRVRRGPGLWPWLLVALIGAGGWLGLSPPGRRLLYQAAVAAKRHLPAAAELLPSTSITVTLLGVPPDARVRLDGSEIPTAAVELPRNGALHLLEVELPGHAPWSVSFAADEDATHQVELIPRGHHR